MPTLQIEHLSEHSQVFQDFTNSDSSNVRADESPKRTHLRHSGHRTSGIGHTGNPLRIGHTVNRSDHEHSVPRSRSVRSDAIEHWSNRTRHHSDVSRSSQRDSNTHRETIPLRHVDPGEHSPASMIRRRRSRSRSRSYDSVSPRRHSHSPSRSRGKKKKSHKKRNHSSTSSSSSRRSSFRERERKRHKSKKKKKKHSKSRSSKRDKHEKKHKRKRSPSPSPSSSSSSVSSDSSSSLQRSPARKKSRVNSRSPSQADHNPHSASRTTSPASHRDHLSLFAENDDEFISHYEDNRDLAPDTLRHSGHRSLGIGHTDNPSDHEHSVHRSQSVRPDTVDHWSILLNRTLLELRSELEHGSASLEPDIVLMFLVFHGEITAHIVQLFPFHMLTQVNTFRLRCSGIVVLEAVLAITTLSLQDFIVAPPLVQEGRRRSHIEEEILPLLVLLITTPPSLLLEKEKGNGTSLKKKHTSLRPFKHD